MYGVVFQAEPPRMVFWSVDGAGLPDALGQPGTLTVAVPCAAAVCERTVPARWVAVAEALPLLVEARRTAPTDGTHSAAALWGAAVLVARHATDDDVAQLVAATPPAARAAPVPGRRPLTLPDAETLIRAFLTETTGLTEPTRPQGDPEGVRISLRVEVDTDDLATAPLAVVVQVHRVADPALIIDARDLWDGTRPRRDRAELLRNEAERGRDRTDALVAIRRAARVWAPLQQLLAAAVPDRVVLGDDEVAELLGGAAAQLAAAGVDVHWPRELARDLTATAVAETAAGSTTGGEATGSTGAPPSDLPGVLAGDGAFDLSWRLALGGEPLTAAERDALAEAHRPVVRLRDRWVLVDPELAGKARQPQLKPLTPIAALGAALTGTAEVDGEDQPVAFTATGWLQRLRQRLESAPDPAPQPAALAATLRDYQLHGLRWLVRMASLGLGGCLADDMGLGKTITLIALHLHRAADETGGARETGEAARPTLVVCPASLLGNWQREIERFAPGVPVQRFHGTGRSLDPQGAGFVLTTYAVMRRDAATLAGHEWGLLVADEAQHVKNPTSATARALRRIPAAARVALTGTPVENNLSELWAILDWTTPGLLGPLAAFRARWAAPIETGADPAAAPRLSRLVGPFLLRRRKSDPGIAPELPRKTTTDRPVPLTVEQAGLYEAVVRETMGQIGRATGMQRRGLILKLLTGLKQICNHPAQYLAEPDPQLPGRSGKLELLEELVDTIIAGEDGAVLVFTQYVAMARLLARHLGDRGVPYQLLHGGTPVAAREQLVRRFQDGQAPVFLLSLKAAGTGLNLTRADHVIHYDRWWNPAVEEQATDRAYRIGQTRPVQVHRIIAEGTVEDRIAQLLESKRELADAVLGGTGEAALSELADAELAELVELRRDL